MVTFHLSSLRRGPSVAAAALALTLTACGSGGTSGSGTGGGTSSGSSTTVAAHNAADVTFARDMVPHHRQATAMAALAPTRAASPQVKALAEQIRNAQDPEITTMTGWLTGWGQPTADAGGHSMGAMPGMGGGSMPGMMSDADMATLMTLTGPAFDREFLTMMTAHHNGAIEMAKAEQAQGQYPPAKELARSIETSQTREVAGMAGLIAKVPGGRRL